MAGKHRRRNERIAKFTALGAATATATALTVGIPAEPSPALDAELAQRTMDADVDLMAAVNQWPDPEDIPDLTAGLGTLGYDFSQFVAELVIRGVVENFNLAALAQATGLDLESLIAGLVGNPDELLGDLLNGVLGEIPIDLTPVLNDILGPVLSGLLVPVLDLLGLTNAEGEVTLLNLLGIIGLDLSDPLNLGNLDVPGLNIITAGPAFTLLKLLGVDLGWTPSLPNAVANEINGTDYLDADPLELVGELLDRAGDALEENPLLGAVLGPVISGLSGFLQNPPIDLPSVVAIRVPVTVGIGLGAFAAAMSYKKVLADLQNQPGAGPYDGDPILGSITILPMLLAFNPARPNGGMFARMYPLLRLLGIDTVNPETHVTSEGGLLQLPLGLSLGGANLIPILLDVGVQYHPSSDFAAWPNPVTLASNLMAGILPTYILRGLALGQVDEQLGQLIEDAFGNLVDGKLALNLYLTLETDTQPLLEPLYLLSDLTSIATLGLGAINPFGMLANALAPAVEALNNLGYTDVVRNPDGTYTRTLDEAAVPTPFFSFPAGINPAQVLPDVINLLVKGFQKEFFSGNPTAAGPNVITNLLGLLTGGGLGPLANLGNLLQGIIDNLNLPGLVPQQQQSALMAATDVPDANARTVTLSTEEGDETASGTGDLGSTEEPAEEEPAVDEEPVVEEPVAEEEPVVEEPVVEEEPVDEEEPVEEEPVEEEPAGEEPAGEEPVDETEEPAADEDEADEDQAEEADKAGESKDEEPTGPKHAKPDTDDDADQQSTSTTQPRHAKPDNDAPNANGANDNDNDNDSDSDSGDSDSDSGAGDKAA